MRSVNGLRAFARGCTACAILAVAGAAQAQINEDWSSGTENGWTTSSEQGFSTWVFDSFLGEWFGADIAPPVSPNNLPESQYLTSPTFTMGADLGLEVEHWFDMENTTDQTISYDAGVLEISVNGGPFTYVPAGAILAGEPYAAPVSTSFQSHIGGLRAFSGLSSGGIGVFVTSSFYLGGFASPGDMVQIRFRLATDISVGDDGWYITRVSSVPLVDPAGACCLDGICSETTQSVCGIDGGVFLGEGTTCAGVVCPAEGSDSCENATSISILPFEIFGSNALATQSGPALTCNGGHSSIHNSVWWTLTGTDQAIRVNAGAVAFDFDEVVAIFEGADCNTMTQIACSDPGNVNLDFFAAMGQTYRIVIGDWGASSGGGDYRLTVTEAPPPPANDLCSNAEILTTGISANGTTLDATGTDVASCGGHTRDVYYAFLPAPNGRYRAFTTGAAVNMSLAAFSQGCPNSGVEIACADPSGNDASVEFTADAIGSAILIRAATSTTSTTSFSIMVEEVASGCTGTDGMCRMATVSDCAAAGGTFLGVDCGLGACCNGGGCSVVAAGDCADSGGAYQGDGTDCATSPNASSSPNIAIPDADPVGTSDFITLSDSETITTVEVLVDVNHTWIGDLVMTLQGPNGATVDLIYRPALAGGTGCCGRSANFVGEYIFSDSALQTVVMATVGFGSADNVPNDTYLPATVDDGFQSLNSAFAGSDAAGTWTLMVSDSVGGDPGVLNGWGLLINGGIDGACDAPPTCVCETDGNDAQVNVFDLLAYLDDWFAQAPGADIDGTPGVNVFDLLSFLDCWFPASAGNPC